jgi:3-phenylpropionate/cinnamic acid dioxygenase small subunit
VSDAELGNPVSDADFIAVLRFLHHEAALLDKRDFLGWLGLMTDDIVYRVLAQSSRTAEAVPATYAIVDVDMGGLKLRVEQIANPRLTHAENPPTHARRFVSNLEATHAAPPDAFIAETNILVHRSRPNVDHAGLYAGARRDVLRRVDGALRIARREVILDQVALRDGSMSLPL